MYRLLVIISLCFVLGCTAQKETGEVKTVASETSMLYFGATW